MHGCPNRKRPKLEETTQVRLALDQKTMETSNLRAAFTIVTDELNRSLLERAKLLGEIAHLHTMVEKVQHQEKLISNLSNEMETLSENQKKERDSYLALQEDFEKKKSDLDKCVRDNGLLSYSNEQQCAEILALQKEIDQKESRISQLETESAELKNLIDEDYNATSPELVYNEPEPEPCLLEPGDPEPTELFAFLLTTGPPNCKLLTSGVKLAEGKDDPWESVPRGGWIHICTTTRDIYKPGHAIGAVEYAYSLESNAAKRWFPTQFSRGFLVETYRWQHFMGASILYDVQDCIKVDSVDRGLGRRIKLETKNLRKTLEDTVSRYINSGRRKVHQGDKSYCFF